MEALDTSQLVGVRTVTYEAERLARTLRARAFAGFRLIGSPSDSRT
jgi:hypothetical protein